MELCDFLVLSPHGVGLQSFLYGIRRLGVRCSTWGMVSTVSDFKKAQEYIDSEKKSHKIVGITLDCPVDIPRNFLFSTKTAIPIFVLVRDPIEIIVSILNQIIGDELVKVYLWQNQASMTGADELVETVMKKCSRYIIFTSLVESVAKRAIPSSRITVFDTKDLREERIEDTLCRVAKEFSVFFSKKRAAISKKSFNAFPSRIFRLLPACCIFAHGDAFLFISIMKKEISSFFNVNIESLFFEFSHNGCEYLAFAKDPNGYEHRYTDVSSLHVVNSLKDVERHARIQVAVVDKICSIHQSMKFDPAGLIAILNKNTALASLLKEVIANEVVQIEKLAPSIVSSWEHMNLFLNGR